MSRRIVHVIGTGTIGEPLIGLLCNFKEDLGIDEITFNKYTPLTTDRSKVANLLKRGARLSTNADKIDGFNDIGIKVEFTSEEAIDRASVVIDCTPTGFGHKNKKDFYEKHTKSTLGFVAQGSEFGFGKMYARGINDSILDPGKDQFIQVVSCNTHNLSTIVKTVALSDGNDNLLEGRFNLIRRANDLSQTSKFIPSPQVGKHDDDVFGTHHARDAHLLFDTMNLKLNLFSSAMKVNSQYMHTVWFNLKVKEPTSKDKVIDLLTANDRISLTEHHSTNEVFSFGRDQGLYGRILNQTVVVEDSINVRNDHEISGFCFTPQDGNSILSSIAATVRFLNPHSYQDKINSLSGFFFDRV